MNLAHYCQKKQFLQNQALESVSFFESSAFAQGNEVLHVYVVFTVNYLKLISCLQKHELVVEN